MHNSGYSRETVMADQLLCERSQAISQTVAMFAGGVGGLGKSFSAIKEVGRSAITRVENIVGRLRSPMKMLAKSNTATEINGIRYTGHALDQMQGRGLVPSVIEDTIATGRVSAARGGCTSFETTQARVITNPSVSVKTVYPYTP